MIVFIDTDILIDVALKREKFWEDSSKIIDLCESKVLHGFIAWHSLSNFYYLTSTADNKSESKQFLKDLLNFIGVAKTGTEEAKKALLMDVPDFEDSLQILSAISCKAEVIITRNKKHYKKSIIPANTPTEFLKQL